MKYTDDYMHMVSALAKPGEDIVASLTPTEAHLWHMATGVAGEAGELTLCLVKTEYGQELPAAEIKEEIGDTLFYLAGIRKCFSSFSPNIGHIDLPLTNNNANLFAQITVWAADILDQIKKHVIYKKPLDQAVLLRSITHLEHYLEELASHVSSSLSSIAEQNMQKLLTGPNARYAEGTYTNKAANERRDKS